MGKRTRVLVLALTICALIAQCGAATAEGPPRLGIVATQYGQLQGVAGETYEDVTVFKGVPYAAPPVGELRWKAPLDPSPWAGVKVCDAYEKIAMQPAYTAQFSLANPDYANSWGTFYPDGFPEDSEDCLYLDIYTSSRTGDEKMPVIVWFHGGGFAHGYGHEVEFNGEALAEKGAIVVDVTHRLNVFGLLSLPQLSAESETGGSGNYIVMDLAQAIRWVYENIAAFGGDPSRITIGGQSGGSSKVTAALISPLTEGMIHGTYNMSALNPFGAYKTLAENEAAGLAFLEALGVAPDISADELRAIPAEEIMAAYDQAGFGGSLCIDGYAIAMNPADYYLAPGKLDGLNMMAGSVYGENGSYEATSKDDLMAKIRAEFGDELVDKYDLESALELTDANYPFYNRQLKVQAAHARNRLFAAIAQAQNQDFRFYDFSFSQMIPGSEIGWHSGELFYMFGSLRDNGRQLNWTEWDHMCAETCTSYWVNFAATGDPNGYGLAEWPAMTVENGLPFEYLCYMPTCEVGLDAFDRMAMESAAAGYGIDFASLGI